MTDPILLPPPFTWFAIFVLGLLFGSFFNVIIVRLPEEESLGGRSRCRSCKKVVPWFHNLPVWSFFWLRGRSACCDKPLSLQYPLVELATALLFVAVWGWFGPGWQSAVYTVLTSYLILISVIDFHHQIIPDELSLSGIPLGFVACWLTGDITWMSSLAGALLGGGLFFSVAYLYERFTGQEGLGGGDVKLLAMLGAWFGIESVLLIIVLSTLLGSLVGVGMMVTRGATSKAAIPFGPFLAIAAWIYLFFRPALLTYFYPALYG